MHSFFSKRSFGHSFVQTEENKTFKTWPLMLRKSWYTVRLDGVVEKAGISHFQYLSFPTEVCLSYVFPALFTIRLLII